MGLVAHDYGRSCGQHWIGHRGKSVAVSFTPGRRRAGVAMALEILRVVCGRARKRTASKSRPIRAPEVFPAAVHEKRPRRIRPISFHPFSRLLDATLTVEVYRLDLPGFPVVRDCDRSRGRKGGGGIHERNVHLACASNKLEVYGGGGAAPGLRLRSKTAAGDRGRRRSGGNSENGGWCGMDFATQPIAQQVVRAEKADRRMKTGVQPFSYTSPPLLLQRYTYMY